MAAGRKIYRISNVRSQSDSVTIYKLKGLLHEFGVIKSENWESESIKRQTAPNNRGCYVSSTFSYEVVEYKTPLLSLNASTVGVLRYVSETCVQDRKLLFRPFKLSKSHLDGRASRPVGRVELVRMFFLSRILCFECVCRFICARV